MTASTTAARDWTSELAALTPKILSAPATSNYPLPPSIPRLIDHTLLKPTATRAELAKLCAEALEHNFRSCCVNTAALAQITPLLAGSDTIPCAVIGFPLGACHTDVKAFETAKAIELGAKEIDMVISLSLLKDGEYQAVYDDIAAVVAAAEGHVVKVIFETVFLSKEEVVAASYISKAAGAKFVKTCTGFLGGQAEVEDVRVMKLVVGDSVEVKASGGVRTRERAEEMVRAGATRIGTSSGVAIVAGGEGTGY